MGIPVTKVFRWFCKVLVSYSYWLLPKYGSLFIYVLFDVSIVSLGATTRYI